MHVTFFPDQFASRMKTAELDLDALAVRIEDQIGHDKNKLAWLKLARFGKNRTEKKCLRFDANVLAVSGAEVEHDEGSMSLEEALVALETARVTCIVYSTPSWVEGTKEKWRVLAPFSKELPPGERAVMVARLNTVLSGKLAGESFTLSQAYYYGHLVNQPYRVEIIEGTCIDLLDGIEGTGKTVADRPEVTGRSGGGGTAPGYTDVDIQNLLALSREEGKWHIPMRSITGSLVNHRWQDEAIHDLCADYCRAGWGDPDLQKLIDDARRKGWGGPQIDMVDLTAKLLALKATVDAKIAAGGGGAGGTGTMFGTWASEELTYSDFFGFMPTHKFIFIATGDLWPAASVDARLAPVPMTKADGTPIMKKKRSKKAEDEQKYQLASTWIDQNRPVEAMTWAPGLDKAVPHKLPTEAGWIDAPGRTTFNLYRPPVVRPGNSANAGPWLALVKKIYPNDIGHILDYFAHRIQKPAEKINHGLLFVGQPGIGKDTIIEPLKLGVGPWNFKEAAPSDVMGQYNGYMVGTVLRISEARDLGEINRYTMYEAMKTVLAAPPDMKWINIKFVAQFYAVNVCGTIITTNHKFDGIYLPADDRRHYVCGTELRPSDFTESYWTEFWGWYAAGGLEDVVALLKERDISMFNAKAAPKKTEAFWQIVNASVAPEVSEVAGALDALGDPRPQIVTLEMVKEKADSALREWLTERKNRRSIPHRMESCGYIPIRNPSATDDGAWAVAGKRQAIYCQIEVPAQDRLRLVTEFKDTADKMAAERAAKIKAGYEAAQTKSDEIKKKGKVIPMNR